MLSILFLFIIFVIVFYIKDYKSLFNKVLNLKNLFDPEKETINAIQIIDNKNDKNMATKNINKIKQKIDAPSINSLSVIKLNNNNNFIEIANRKDIENSKEKKSDKYIDSEINNLEYNQALTKDKRTYFQYYLSLIKKKNLLLFSFFPRDDYNSQIIKICLFFHSFSLNYFINTLFFNDATMHQIYLDEGVFNFIYLIPQMIYSTIIASVITIVLRYLSLTEKKIIDLKKSKDLKEYNYKYSKWVKAIKIKFIIFYVISFLILGIIWYYISCFCSVYKNTQVYLIEDTLISFAASFLYPFFICLIPGIIRIPSLKNPGESLYKFSLFLQFLFE